MRHFVKLNGREIRNGGYTVADGAIAINSRVCVRAVEQLNFAPSPEALQLLGKEPLKFESGMESIRQTLRADKLGDQVERNIGCDSRPAMMLCRLNYLLAPKLPISTRQISTGRFADHLRDNFSDSDSKSMAPCLKARLSRNLCMINCRNARDDLSDYDRPLMR